MEKGKFSLSLFYSWNVLLVCMTQMLFFIFTYIFYCCSACWFPSFSHFFLLKLFYEWAWNLLSDIKYGSDIWIGKIKRQNNFFFKVFYSFVSCEINWDLRCHDRWICVRLTKLSDFSRMSPPFCVILILDCCSYDSHLLYL